MKRQSMQRPSSHRFVMIVSLLAVVLLMYVVASVVYWASYSEQTANRRQGVKDYVVQLEPLEGSVQEREQEARDLFTRSAALCRVPGVLDWQRSIVPGASQKIARCQKLNEPHRSTIARYADLTDFIEAERRLVKSITMASQRDAEVPANDFEAHSTVWRETSDELQEVASVDTALQPIAQRLARAASGLSDEWTGATPGGYDALLDAYDDLANAGRGHEDLREQLVDTFSAQRRAL